VEKEELVLSRPPRVLALLATILMVVGGCGGPTATTTPSQAGTASQGPPATLGPTAPPAQTFHIPEFEPANLRWFCCLGGGEEAPQTKVENAVAADFATRYPGSTLKFEVTTYDAAADALSVQIRGDNSPDIAGPVGVGGIAQFEGQWLDLTPYLEESAYDLGQFPQNLVEFNQTSDGQIGVPYSLYPSVLYYVPDMFEEIGLNEPPHTYGEQYEMPDGTMVDWNYDTVRELAMLLTVDKNGFDATEPEFDPEHIVQYGFEPQRDDLRGLGAYFGAGNLDSGDGATAAIPPAWAAAWKWVYNGIWTDHFIMSDQTFNTDAIAGGDQAFFSGKVAMSTNFLWITYGLGSDYGDTGGKWDLAAVPAYNGTITAPLNADTFSILKGTKNPDAAFAAFVYLTDERGDELLQVYGGMPAREAERPAFLESLAATPGFPEDADWQVANDSLQYADVPNFEGAMPKYNPTNRILRQYRSRWLTTGGLDIDAQIAQLLADVQAEWDK
jgi:multiple sugar transport system substrate-binding protein